MNTDAQDLKKLDEGIEKILVGPKITRGLGAGGFPEYLDATTGEPGGVRGLAWSAAAEIIAAADSSVLAT